MQQNSISSKKVLLVTNIPILREDILHHGTNLSKRMDASLEVLHLVPEGSTEDATMSFKTVCSTQNYDEPIGYIQLVNDRGFTKETVEYAKNRRNILCIVLCLLDTGKSYKKGSRQKRLNEVTSSLNYPVVLATDGA